MKNILNGKVLIAALTMAGLLLCASLVYIWFAQPGAVRQDPSAATSGQGLAALTVIPAPTSTPRHPFPTPTPFPPTPTSSPTPAPGQIAIGMYVQIVNTGEEGLNIRAEAGLNAAVIFPGRDAEVFLVTDGPVDADGYTWWRLTASYDVARSGWAVQDYLSVIPSP